MSETAQRATSADQPRAKRPYEPPTVSLFGSVEEFTRGAGVSGADANPKTRKTGAG